MPCSSFISRTSRSMRWRAGGSRPLVGSSRIDQLRAVHDRLGQLGHLLHAQRIRVQLAIPRLAQAHMEQRFVRFFERNLPEGSPESSAIRRRKETAVMLAMKESISGI